jgi:quinate dehydrogenase
MDILHDSYQYGASPLTPDSIQQPLQISLFGKPISKSLSPLLQSILFNSISAKWQFSLTETTDSFDLLQKRQEKDFIGASITMPNKVTFKANMDDLTPEALAIGAINTSFVRIDRHDGRRRNIGANTDCIGIRDTLVQTVPGIADSARGQPAMVIGGGGAARSAVYALWRWMQPSEIYIANRLQSEVDDIISSFRDTVPEMKLRYIGFTDTAKELSTPYIVIGTIPDYPATTPGEIGCRDVCDLFLARQDKGVLLDMCYMPSPFTRLFTEAKNQKWKVISGTEVLVRVIIAQQILWLEREPSEAGEKAALVAIWELASEKKNAVRSLKL